MLLALTTTAVSACAAIIAVFITSYLTRRREREAEWRKLKIAQYQDLIRAISLNLEGRCTSASTALYSDAYNSTLVFAPIQVVNALQRYQDEITCTNQTPNVETQYQLCHELICAIRKDIAGRAEGVPSKRFALITIPPGSPTPDSEPCATASGNHRTENTGSESTPKISAE